MIVYNLFKGVETPLYQHLYSSYISGKHTVKANFSITIDYKPEQFKTIIPNCTLRDIIIYENLIYYNYQKCVLEDYIINSKEQKITLRIKGDWHHFISELPDWVIADIRIAAINNIIQGED